LPFACARVTPPTARRDYPVILRVARDAACLFHTVYTGSPLRTDYTYYLRPRCTRLSRRRGSAGFSFSNHTTATAVTGSHYAGWALLPHHGLRPPHTLILQRDHRRVLVTFCVLRLYDDAGRTRTRAWFTPPCRLLRTCISYSSLHLRLLPARYFAHTPFQHPFTAVASSAGGRRTFLPPRHHRACHTFASRCARYLYLPVANPTSLTAAAGIRARGLFFRSTVGPYRTAHNAARVCCGHCARATTLPPTDYLFPHYLPFVLRFVRFRGFTRVPHYHARTALLPACLRSGSAVRFTR